MSFCFKVSIGYNSKEQTHSIVWGFNAAGPKWTHVTTFHIFNSIQEGTQPFTVSYSCVRRLRYRISRGLNLSQADINEGWNKHFVFWAIPHNGRWFPPPHPAGMFDVPTKGNGMPGNCSLPPKVPSHISSSARLERAKRHNTAPTRRRPELAPGERGAMGLKRQITLDTFTPLNN